MAAPLATPEAPLRDSGGTEEFVKIIDVSSGELPSCICVAVSVGRGVLHTRALTRAPLKRLPRDSPEKNAIPRKHA